MNSSYYKLYLGTTNITNVLFSYSVIKSDKLTARKLWKSDKLTTRKLWKSDKLTTIKLWKSDKLTTRKLWKSDKLTTRKLWNRKSTFKDMTLSSLINMTHAQQFGIVNSS